MLTTLENLYEVFAGYSPKNLQACPCCHSDAYLEMLKAEPLETLYYDDLREYVASALSTCGDIDDFRYFLPRLFELERFDLWEFYDKFHIANWKEKWPPTEVEAIENHILTEWLDGTSSYVYEDFLLFFSFSKLLSLWQEDVEFLKANIAHWEKRGYFSSTFFAFFDLQTKLEPEEKDAICAFLEKAYWDNIEQEPKFAHGISQVNDWFDWYEI